MIWVFNKYDLWRYGHLVDDFLDLYQHPSNFPDENEREEISTILERIINGSQNPITYLLLIEKSPIKVSGGAIMEFYNNSKCALLTYLFIGLEDRGKGIAKSIIKHKEGLSTGILKWQSETAEEIEMVFFEVNSPDLTNSSSDSMLPSDRLNFFLKIGGKILDIPYTQPPLDKTKKPVDNLLFLTFPFLNKKQEDKINADVFYEFYKDFCTALEMDNFFYCSIIEAIKKYLREKYNDDSFIYLR